MSLIAQLYRLQEEHGWLREDDLRSLAEKCRIPLYRLQGLMSFYPHFRTRPPPRHEVAICRDMSCYLADGEEACARWREQLADREGVAIQEVSCLGRCEIAPAACVNHVPVSLADPEDLLRWIDNSEKLVSQKSSRKLPAWGDPTPTPRRWKCDPYAGPDEHYSTYRKWAAEASSEVRIIETLKASELRGMGGAGFPTGIKWELVRSQERRPKYVVVNADESEPGTFKDRVILAEMPHLVIEGALLAAWAVGAQKTIVYIRHEYEPERQVLESAIQEARARGVLEGVEVEIFVSPGGYILGEETALLEALEDKRGEPRNKPPFPATHGLWGQPTLINNVETLAMVPAILHHGPDWWKSQGRAPFQGLKFMAVSGHVARAGVYEVPMGTPVAELIELAGGLKDGKRLKAFAPGGASSPFLPASQADVPIDFQALQQAGSMLGSGALVVVAEGTDMLRLAANVVRFFRNESCGKCVPCRVGTQKTVEMLEAVLAGQRRGEDLEHLPELADTLQLTSICGLGQVALNPILSVLRYFPQDAASNANTDIGESRIPTPDP